MNLEFINDFLPDKFRNGEDVSGVLQSCFDEMFK